MDIKRGKEKIAVYLGNSSKIYPMILRKFRRLKQFIDHPVYAFNYFKSKFSKHSEIINFKPAHIVFYSTDKCNLKCGWCLMNSAASKDIQHRKMKDLDLGTFKRILKICPSIESLSFTGQGEPLLNKDIFDMIDYTSRKKLRVYLTTNALPLDNEAVKKIMRSNVVHVNLSLKGKDAKEFSEVTGMDGELFDRQVMNIQRLASEKKKQKHSVILRVSYVVSRDNFRNMGEVIKLAEDMDVDKLLFDNFVPFNDFESGKGCIFEDDVEIKNYIECLNKASRAVEVEFPILLRRKDFSYYCCGYYKFVNIDAEGNISGCMRVLTPNPEYGNIFRDRDYMNTSHFRQIRKMHINKILPSRCRYCIEMSKE